MGACARRVLFILKTNKISSAKNVQTNCLCTHLIKLHCAGGPAEARPKFPTVDKLMVNKQNPSLLYFQFTWRGAIMDPSA
jgi:hypothetical protein